MTDATKLEPCSSCGAAVPAIDGPTHRYMLSSPGCWAVYGEVLAREYSDALYMKNHRLTVDAYAVQHPGQPSRQSIRSVCMHLCTLYVVLERGIDLSKATAFLQQLALREDYEWLEPPDDLGEVTVLDIHGTSSLETHLAMVERWARSAWQAWERHHDTIRSWARQCSVS